MGVDGALHDLPDVEVLLTKDPMVLADPQGTAPADRKVLGGMAVGKGSSAQRITAAAVGATEVYVVVRPNARGAAKTGPYTLGVRRAP